MTKNIGSFQVQKRAAGGHVGPLPGPTPGRADKVDTTVEDGSHILSADCVSALGDGNTEAGYAKLMKLFPNSNPHRAFGGTIGAPKLPGAPHIAMPRMAGIPHPHITSPAVPHLAGVPGLPKQPHLAKGGNTKQVPCKLSHGEFAVSAKDVKDVAGKGDIEHGHRVLDAFQMHVRKGLIDKLKKLPGPVQS